MVECKCNRDEYFYAYGLLEHMPNSPDIDVRFVRLESIIEKGFSDEYCVTKRTMLQ